MQESGRPESLQSETRFDERLLAAADSQALSLATEKLALGDSLAAAGDTSGAIRALRAAAKRSPSLADWSLALAAELHARRGELRDVGEVLALLPEELRTGWGWRSAARASVRAQEPDSAIAIARRALPLLTAAADSAEAFRLLGEARVALGDSADARSHFRAAIALSPASVSAGGAALRLGQLGPRAAADHHALLEFNVAIGNLSLAAGELERSLLHTGTDATARAEARLRLAEAQLASGRVKEVERTLGNLTAAAPTASHRARALLLAARARSRQGRRDASRWAMEEAAKLGETAAGQEALYILADLDQDAGRTSAARRRFEHAVQYLPHTEWGAEAAVRLGTMALFEGETAEARAVFEHFRSSHRQGWRFQQATYWTALVAREMGDSLAARALFLEAARADPASYYGIRAGEEAELPTLRERLPAGPAVDTVIDRLARGAVARVEALEAVGLGELASAERALQRAHFAQKPGGLHALAEALHARGRFLEAVRLGREARRAGGAWDVRSLRIVFPFPYQDAILAAAERNAVDPYLVAGLIRQESLFQAAAESRAGALGLMQLMPRTARSLASRQGIEKFEPESLRLAEVNVSLGALHLSDLLRRHRGRVEDVLAEYNAGAGRLGRWKRHPEYGHPGVFLERIPYRETREYIRTVTENARIYEAVYGDGGAKARMAAHTIVER